MESSPLLDDYILSCASNNPRICFIATAAGDSTEYITRFYRRFTQADCQPTHLELFRRDQTDLEDFLLSQDIIYVSGGNTANMLAIWAVHGIDRILEKALAQGIVLCGISAGSICWFEEGMTDSFGQTLEPYSCLGFLAGSNCPHYDGEAERKPTYHRLVSKGLISPGIAADDSAALHYIDGELYQAVSSKTGAAAYRLEECNGEVIEARIPTLYLGD